MTDDIKSNYFINVCTIKQSIEQLILLKITTNTINKTKNGFISFII